MFNRNSHLFHTENESDTVYFTAGHAMGPSISYNNITFGNPSDPNTLEASENFRTIDVNKYWLRCKLHVIECLEQIHVHC